MRDQLCNLKNYITHAVIPNIHRLLQTFQLFVDCVSYSTEDLTATLKMFA